jgi:predicted PurR-regulated permease PerM
MKVKLEIDTRTFVRFWLVVIGFVTAAGIIYSARTALIIIASAVFLALVLNPPVSRIAKALPGRSRVGGTALAYAAVVLAIGTFLVLVVPPIVQQTAKVFETIPALVNSATTQYKGLSTFIDTYDLQPQVDNMLNSVKDSASALAGAVGSNLVSGIGSFFYGVSILIMILGLSFFMLVEGPVWMGRLWNLYVDKDLMNYHRSLTQRMYTVVTSYVTGQLSVSAIAGSVAGVTVFILSLIFNVPTNFAIPAAAIVFILSLIPMFGEMIGALLIGLVLAFNDLSAAISFFVIFIIYMQIENNLIVPKIQSKRIDLSALVILIAVITGIFLFGIAGGIISIPIAGCVKIFVEEYINRKKSKHKKSDSVVSKTVKTHS